MKIVNGRVECNYCTNGKIEVISGGMVLSCTVCHGSCSVDFEHAIAIREKELERQNEIVARGERAVKHIADITIELIRIKAEQAYEHEREQVAKVRVCEDG